jgi:hypothetical protein
MKNWSTGKKVLIFGVILLAIICATVAITVNVTGNKTDNSQQTPATQLPSNSDTSSASWGKDSICGYEPNGETQLETLPKDIEMKYMYGTYIPTSPTAGPCKKTEAGYHYGWAPTVEGAVLAASSLDSANIFSSYKPDIKNHSLTINYKIDDTPWPTGSTIRPLSFKVLDFKNNYAEIRNKVVGKSMGKKQMMSEVAIFKWQDGDWKLDKTKDNVYLDDDYTDNIKFKQK